MNIFIKKQSFRKTLAWFLHLLWQNGLITCMLLVISENKKSKWAFPILELIIVLTLTYELFFLTEKKCIQIGIPWSKQRNCKLTRAHRNCYQVCAKCCCLCYVKKNSDSLVKLFWNKNKNCDALWRGKKYILIFGKKDMIQKYLFPQYQSRLKQSY